MNNVSLVAFYGAKPLELKKLIQQLQQFIASHELINNQFIPYQLEQVHGTIIGCEGFKTESGIVNLWFKQHRQQIKYIDLEKLADYLDYQLNLPITIRFGGYDSHQQYNFLSRNEHPYDRSFQLQPFSEQTIPLLIGWSWEKEKITLAIDNLRHSFKQFNLLHKYHLTDDAIDNDLYLRLGTIKISLTEAERQKIALDLRNLLAQRSPLCLSLNRHNIAFAQYQDLSLTPEQTKILPISEITNQSLQQLYSIS